MAPEARFVANPQQVAETIPDALRSATDVEVFDSRTEARRCRGLENTESAVDVDENTVVLRMHNAGFSGGQFLTIDRTTYETLLETNALR